MAYESPVNKHCNLYRLETANLKSNRALETRIDGKTVGEFRVVLIILIFFDFHFSNIVRRCDFSAAC